MDLLPPFVFEGQPDRRMVAAAVRHVSRRRLWVVRLVGVIIGLAGAAMLFADGGLVPGVTFVVLGGFWIVAMPLIAVHKAVRASMKIIGHPTAYRVDEEGVHQNNRTAATTFRWPLISGIEELPDQVLVRVGKVQFLPLPTSTLAPPTRGAMVSFLCGRLAGVVEPVTAPQPGALRPPAP